MSINEIQTTVTAKVWQSIAQSGIDTSGVPREDMNKLVDLVVDAALEAVDDQLNQIEQSAMQAQGVDQAGVFDNNEEDILWQGRPLLSLTLHYMITDERVKISEGLLGKEWVDIELVRIQAMDFKQSLTERAMNVGDIFITTGDPKNPEVVLENIKDPKQVHEILRRAVLNARQKYGLRYREEM